MLRIDINLLFTAINLIVLYIGIRLFLFKPIRKILKQRQDEVEQEYTAAEAAKAEALERENTQKQLLAEYEQTRETSLAEAESEAHAEYERIVREAQQQAKAIIGRAETEAQLRTDELYRQAQDEICDIILSASAKVAVNGDSAEDLYDTFLRKAGGADEPSGE